MVTIRKISRAFLGGIYLSVVLCLLSVSVIHSLAYAKDMYSPTLTEAIAQSQWIVVAEYVSYAASDEIGYFYGPLAKYKIINVLKGEQLKGNIQIGYEFHNGSACIELENWQFSDELMPKDNSRWILFLKNNEQGAYATYRGDYGRWPASSENLQKVKEQLN